MENTDRPLNIRDEYRVCSQEKLLEIQKSMNMETELLLFNVRTSGNIAMIIRSACLMGCQRVTICGRKHYDKRFTVGSDNYIPVVYNEKPLKVTITCERGTNPVKYVETFDYNVEEFVKVVQGRTPVFMEQGGTDIQEVPWKIIENPIVILGNESLGIPKDFIKAVKQTIPTTLTVSIPQWSVMRSLNVAVTASIVLWEIRKTKSDLK
jgi:tRNA G18 (ribose-2'-O)-methylase SpoU